MTKIQTGVVALACSCSSRGDGGGNGHLLVILLICSDGFVASYNARPLENPSHLNTSYIICCDSLSNYILESLMSSIHQWHNDLNTVNSASNARTYMRHLLRVNVQNYCRYRFILFRIFSARQHNYLEIIRFGEYAESVCTDDVLYSKRLVTIIFLLCIFMSSMHNTIEHAYRHGLV